MSVCTHARRLARRPSDAGFTVIELMVSLTILGLVSAAFAYGLQLSLFVTQADRARVQGANLAAREIETVRNQFGSSKSAPLTVAAASQVTNGTPLPGQTAGNPLTLDGTAFTVVRTVEWLPAGAGASPCDGGSAVTYPSLAVNVRVTWTQHGVTRDVESNTILTPPKGTLATVKGFIAAKIQGAAGTGVADVPVDITGPGGSQTRMSSPDGCAVFAVDTAGSYTVILNDPGYVSFDGQLTTSKPATVASGTIQVVPFSYDRSATLKLEYEVTDGVGSEFAKPSPLPSVVLFNPSLPNMGRKEITSGTTTVANLWPFTNGYSIWAGTCTLNDPASSGGKRPAAVIPAPGGTLTAKVPLKPIEATFLDASDNPVVGKAVTAQITDNTGCKQTTFALGTTDSVGVVTSALPFGTWTLTAGSVSLSANVSADPATEYPLKVPEGS